MSIKINSLFGYAGEVTQPTKHSCFKGWNLTVQTALLERHAAHSILHCLIYSETGMGADILTKAQSFPTAETRAIEHLLSACSKKARSRALTSGQPVRHAASCRVVIQEEDWHAPRAVRISSLPYPRRHALNKCCSRWGHRQTFNTSLAGSLAMGVN